MYQVGLHQEINLQMLQTWWYTSNIICLKWISGQTLKAIRANIVKLEWYHLLVFIHLTNYLKPLIHTCSNCVQISKHQHTNISTGIYQFSKCHTLYYIQSGNTEYVHLGEHVRFKNMNMYILENMSGLKIWIISWSLQ